MRLLAPMIVFFVMAVSPSLALAEGEKALDISLRNELKILARKVDEIKAQNKAIQETQVRILQEIEVLKVRIRRS